MKRSGFTLIEVLAAVFLTSIVIASAVAFYINLSDATRVASQRTREGRHAVSGVPRVTDRARWPRRGGTTSMCTPPPTTTAPRWSP